MSKRTLPEKQWGTLAYAIGENEKRIMKAENMTFNSTEKSTFGELIKIIVVKSVGGSKTERGLRTE